MPFRWRPVGLYLWIPKLAAGAFTPFIAAAGLLLAIAGAAGLRLRSRLSRLATLAVGNTTAWSVPGVPNGTYFVRVKALNGTFHGPPSNEVVVVVP